MPYIGNNHIAGDHTNNFKVLDDISSFTATFDGSATSVVNTTNNTIRVVEHRFIQGQRVTYTNGSGGNIGGLTTGTAYFVSFDSANTIKLATTLANANNNTVINLSAVGSGTSHTLNAAFDGVNKKFKLTHGSGSDARLNNASQINVAINNVVQRPNLDPNNFTDGFALEDNHKIVFKTAPTSEDIFWGSIIANTLTTFDISDHKIDTFTGDGSTTEFNLSHTPANNESLMVSINGVLQHPSNASTARAYTLIANVIQFTSAPGVGDEIQVRHMGFAGATTADVSGFYGRTGNVVLGSTDHITTGDITSRNINASGILTASSASFGGNVSIGGTLTYEDVTNIDSVGVVTARNGIDCNGDIDVDGHTNLDNVSIAGVTTFSDDVYFDGATAGRDIIFDRSANTLQVKPNAILKIGQGSYSTDLYTDGTNTIFNHNQNAGLFIKANIFQVYGNGTSGGNTYDGTIFRCMNGKTELGYEVPNGGATTLDNLVTTPIGVTVGTGVTIERNGQATFVGVTTFGNLVGGATTSVVVNRDLVLRDSWGYGNHIKFHWGNNTLNFPSASLSNIARLPKLSFGDRTSTSQLGVGDFLMYHDYYNMHMRYYGANGNLVFSNKNTEIHISGSNGSGNPQQSIRIKSGSTEGVILHHGGNAKFETAGIGASVYGTLVATGADINGDLDVDGHTNLDNVSIAGVTTMTGALTISSTTDQMLNLNSSDNNGTSLAFQRNGSRQGYIGYGGASAGLIIANEYINGAVAIQGNDGGSYINMLSFATDNKGLATLHGGATIPLDLDVDGHTNLDNVSIAGVTTFTGRSDHSSSLQMLAGNNIVLHNDAGSANCQIDCYGGAGFRLTSYNQTMFTCENGNTTKFYTNSGTSRLEITNGGDVLVVSGSLYIPDAIIHSGDTDTKIRFPAADTFSVETAGSEKLRITSAGITSSISSSDATPNFKWRSDDINWHGYLNQTVHGSTISTLLSCGGSWTVDGTTYNATKDYDGSFGTLAMAIHNQYNGGAGGFVFLNKDGGGGNGGGGVHELLRIKHDGKVGIGTNTMDSSAEVSITNATSSARVYMKSADNADCSIYFGSMNDAATGAIRYDHSDDSLRLYGYNNSERLRIDSVGRVFINRTAQHASSSERLSVNGMTSIQFNSTTTAGLYIFNEETTTSGNPTQPFIFLHDGGGIRAGLGVQRSTGITALNGQFGLSFRTGASGVGGSERARIDSSGRVLIGGTSNSASSHADELQVINTSAEGGISIINGDSSMGHIYFGDTSGSAQGRIDYNHGGNYMRFYTADNERLRIDSNGRVLINTTSNTNAHTQSDDLVVGNTSHGHDTGITIVSNPSYSGWLVFSDGTSADDQRRASIVYQHSSDTLYLRNSGNQNRLIIDSNGNIGVNATPVTSGTLYNTVDHFLVIGDSDTGIAQDGDGQLELWANNQEIANFNTGGVNITTGLTVGGVTRVGNSSGSLGINCTPATSGSFGSKTSKFAIGDNDTGLAQISDGNLAFYTNNAEIFRIDQYGNAGLGVAPRTAAGGVNNDTDVFLAIGDSDTGIAQDGDGQFEIWANNQEIANFNAGQVTFTKTLELSDGNFKVASGHGIDFSASTGGNSTNSILDDYEEGTFSIGVTDSNNTFTTGQESGRYIKIGHVVHCTFTINCTISGTSGYAFFLTGFPYTVKNYGSHANEGLGSCKGTGQEIQLEAQQDQTKVKARNPASGSAMSVNDVGCTGNVVKSIRGYIVYHTT